MPNGASRATTGSPAEGISGDFVTGSTQTGLDRIRTRLLDLTNRNKLLNYRHTAASSLRVVDVCADAVFRRLRDGDKLAFLPVPEPDVEGVSAKDYADELGWNTSFELDAIDRTAQSLPVLHFHEPLDTLSRKIATAARTAIEESGANMLYLVFGFLEWYESDDSKQSHLAPLVVLPVAIDRPPGKARAVETIVEYSGEDLETNLSLVEKMRRDFGLEMPFLEEDDTPEGYFRKFDEIIRLKKSWSIRRYLSLCLLSFGKLLMYRDLDPRTWPADQNIALHPLVRDLFEGSKNPNIALAEEYPIDAPELAKDVPHLIRDADSSQHSALVDALRGQNLVIEGPPGTGKSQTITNLIAAALARGKTVLFVAEKLAALEVVRRRLDDAGLGTFCLEVHSHKTKKNALINDIALRFSARGTFKEPRELDRHLFVAEDKKRLLSQYASLINKTIAPINATVFEILWARDRSGQEVSTHCALLAQVILPVVLEYDRTQFTRTEQFLAVYGKHLTAVFVTCTSLHEHPWSWITSPLVFEQEERVLMLLREFLEAVRQADAYCERLHSIAGIALNPTYRGLDNSAHMLALLPQSESALSEELMALCQTAEMRHSLSEFVGQVESFHTAFAKASAYLGNVNAVLDADSADQISRAFDSFARWGIEGSSVAQVRELLGATADTARFLRKAHASFLQLLNVIGCDAPVTLSSAAFLLETARIVETAPFERLHLRLPALEREHTKPVLQTAQHEANSLKTAESELGAVFDLTLSAGTIIPGQLFDSATILDTAPLWQRWFGRDYRQAVNVYRRIARAAKKPSRSKMSAALRKLGEYTQKRAQFERHTAYREMLGVHFQGVASPWDDLHALLLWYEQIFVALPEHQAHAEPFRKLVFTARIEHLKAIRASVGPTDEHRQSLEHIVKQIGAFTRAVPGQRSLLLSEGFDKIAGCLQAFTAEIADALGALERAQINEGLPLRDMRSIMAAGAQCRAALSATQQMEAVSALLGAAYRGVNTEIAPIKCTVQFAETIASGSLPRQTVEWLLCREYGSRLAELRNSLTGARDCGAKLTGFSKELADLSGCDLWINGPDLPFAGLQAMADCANANPEELSPWNHFLRMRIQSKESGLERLTALAEVRALQPGELPSAFHFVFYNTLARSVFAENADLSHVTGITQEQLQHQFAAADREAIRLYSERMAALGRVHTIKNNKRVKCL